MAQSMAELRSIILRGQSPTANGRLTARTIEVAEPSACSARKIKQIRNLLNVSQSVFARIVGVSDVLVRSWERGARQPSPIARRLLDQIHRYPGQFMPLVHSSPRVRPESRKRSARTAA
jgi:putative transcriptional regulator